jgi:polysaccharide pyruvyl transferase WcaK-like protein
MIWARDEDSLDALRELLGADFDARRHRAGVDLAFALPLRPPAQALPDPLPAWLEDNRDLVAVNVSGLLWNQPEEARVRYGLTIDYRVTLTRLVQRLAEAHGRVLLVPHVITRPGHFEHDVDACQALLKASGAAVEAAVLPEGLGPAETKWIISRCAWCCATRMHAAIAGLSSGVPTAAVAYSGKTRGVFATCGQENHVADGRGTTTGDAIERLWSSFETRDSARARLKWTRPEVLARAEAQLDDIFDRVRAGRGQSTGARAA